MFSYDFNSVNLCLVLALRCYWELKLQLKLNFLFKNLAGFRKKYYLCIRNKK